MEHIDEGTIHAWLDGALPADDGARIEAHVASCATCAAAVAEARGLIAASSRILSALDDVPGGVIPVAVVTAESELAQPPAPTAQVDARRGESATAPPHVSSRGDRSMARTARRPWYRRPQWAAAAGISFLAVAATAVWQRNGAPSVMDSVSERAASAPAPTAADQAEGAMATAAEPGAASLASGASANAPAAVSQESAKARALRSDASTAIKEKVAAPSASFEAKKELAAMAKRAVRSDSTAPNDVKASERDAVRRAAVPAAPPPSVASMANELRARNAADSTAAKRVGAVTADAITRSESARVAAEARLQRRASDMKLEGVVVTGTSSAARGAPLRAPEGLRDQASAATPATPASLAGCYRLQPFDAAVASGLSGTLQLDFAGAGSDESRPAYAAREVGGSSMQTALARELFRWTLSSNGEVVLVRGEGTAARRVTMRIGVPLDSLATQQLQGTRISCPAP